MKIPGTDAHLSYCLNVYPSSTISDIFSNVFTKADQVKTGLKNNSAGAEPFGVGLWIPQSVLDRFSEPSCIEEFKARLTESGMYIFTMNGFPYGIFHGSRVKKEVYRPDWSDPLRVQYTMHLGDLLAELLPEDVTGTISTVPVTFGEWSDTGTIQQAITYLMDTVVHFHSLKEHKKKHIILALEPEPGCFLQHTDDIIPFFREKVFTKGASYLAEHLGIQQENAREIIREHLGICIDAIHTSVMFEDPVQSIRRLETEGIRIAKIHLGGAIEIDTKDVSPAKTLSPFNDDVYLHQTSVRTQGGENLFYIDLPDALHDSPEGLWRVHYHIPLADSERAGITNTSGEINSELLQTALAAGVTHFEVEVYTLDIMPEFDGDIEKAMTKDLIHVLNQFRNS